MNIKKRIVVIACTAALLSTAIMPMQAFAQKSNEIKILLNDQRLKSDVPPYIIPSKNVTMMPFRSIGEGIGATVDWNPASKEVMFEKNGRTIVLKEGSDSAMVDGQQKSLDVSAQMKAGRVMVPLRFVSENLGVAVQWDAKSRTVVMTMEDGEVIEIPAVRGTWISTVYNIDWPSDPRKSFNAEKQKQEYTAMLDKLQQTGLNTVFVQVRPTADAFYPSTMLPWSEWLTGKQGKDPGYDPLAFMIEETHKRGMQFHAWFNPYRISVQGDVNKLVPTHPARKNPNWVVKHSDKLLFDPGVPAAREFILDSIMEVVENYNIDGIHLDDYFYPYGQEREPFKDDASYRTYNKVFNNKNDWRRNNVNLFVQELSERIEKTKPNVSFGISPFGVWRNKSVDPTGSATKAGVTSYDSLHADVRKWIQSSWIDYVAPQVYWHIGHNAASYDTVTDWWIKETEGTDVDLYIGHAAYKLADPKEKQHWTSAEILIEQLRYNERYKEDIEGSIFFSAADIMKNTKQVADELSSYYAEQDAEKKQ
ncbi:family 10 glycosylhydrolase [Paenibacillus arenosi]|uniref:Family 10 glycosylhydrolase n=1 Tax=Paenibacillus arenosi TaxID=2774142 RepID=A0ABR9AV39_9BACL|nr:family 10 glycosylhydrolase [Paenibacillus arenosi]MBD8497756.1 family 10 glycosylhydrolase [Paenibacillus arenosi]